MMLTLFHYYTLVTVWALMASSNWRNVPASSFRVSKPSRRKPVIAAAFPSASSDEQKSGSSAGQLFPSSLWPSDLSDPSFPHVSSGCGSQSVVADPKFQEAGVESDTTCCKSGVESDSTRSKSQEAGLKSQVLLQTSPKPTTSTLHDDFKSSSISATATYAAEDTHLDNCGPDVSGSVICQSSLPSDTQEKSQISNPMDSISEGHTAQQEAFSKLTSLKGQSTFVSNLFPSCAFNSPTFVSILQKYLPYTSHRLRYHRLMSSHSTSGTDPGLLATQNKCDPLSELDDVTESSGGAARFKTTPPIQYESSTVSVENKVMPDRKSKVRRGATRPMDVPGILITRHTSADKCAAEIEQDGHVRESEFSAHFPVDAELTLSPESDEMESEPSNKRLRNLSSSTGASETGTTSSRPKLRKAERKKGDEKSGKKTKDKRPTPNAFVSVRILSPVIREGLAAVQEGMVEKDEEVRTVLTSLDKLHITLSVVRLESDDDQERAKVALFEAARRLVVDMDLSRHMLTLRFSGLSSFGQNVVFADVIEKERLERMAGIVQSVFQDHGFPDTGGQSSSFCPHLTIAKMSQSRRGRSGRRERGREGRERGCGRRQRGRRRGGRGLKGLQEELYEEFKDTEFGAEEVTGIELLSMVHPPAEDGYYHCFQRFSFDKIRN